MDNQHRQIKGYRELTQADIDLMNAIKQHGATTELVIAHVLEYIAEQRPSRRQMEGGFVNPEDAQARADEQARLDLAQPERWAAIARTHFQQGLMALTRAVAQPTFF